MQKFIISKTLETASRIFDKEFEYSKGGPLSTEGGEMEIIAELNDERIIEVSVRKFKIADGFFYATFSIENNGQVIFERRLCSELR